MEKMASVKVINRSSLPLPHYETEGSAGVDLRANIESNMVLEPLMRVIVPTGLFIELPLGYEAQIRPRSGLALKQGLTILNSPGTIDSDYRGEIGCILINLSDQAVVIKPGDRIAQLVLSRYERVEWKEVERLSDTVRGTGGFGSTGTAGNKSGQDQRPQN